MRPIETWLLIAVVISLIYLLVLKPNNDKAVKQNTFYIVLGVFFSGLLLYHLWSEGWRWQFLPVYLVSLHLVFKLLKRDPISKSAALVTSVISLVCLGLAIFTPVPKHPEITGTYPVGTDSIEISDPEGTRVLPVKLWFPMWPAKAESLLKKSPWVTNLEHVGPEIARRGGVPEFTFQHLKYFNAAYQTPFNKRRVTDKPMVLLSHGREAIKEFNTFMALELASHGHIVVAPDHTDGALITVLNDGRRMPFKPGEFAEDKEYSEAEKLAIVRMLGQRWANDQKTVLDFLQKQYPELTNRRFFNGGHSTGAAAAIEFCDQSQTCLGTVALDAWMKPVSPSVLTNGSSKPVLAIFGDQSFDDFEPVNQERFSRMKRAMEKNNIPIEFVEIKKARHIDFCDAALLSPYSYLLGQEKGRIDTHEVMRSINERSLEFIDKVN